MNNWVPAIAQEMINSQLFDPEELESEHISAAIKKVNNYYRQYHLVIFMFNKTDEANSIRYEGNLHKVCPAKTFITNAAIESVGYIYEQI